LGRRLRPRKAFAALVAAALQIHCEQPSAPAANVDPAGSYTLSTVDDAPVPATLYLAGAAAVLTGGWLVLADGVYETGTASLLRLPTESEWFVERGQGTYSVQGSTVHFSDSGDGEGPFAGEWAAGRLTFDIEGITFVFGAGTPVARVELESGVVELTTCAPLRLGVTAEAPSGVPVPLARLSWESSRLDVAAVDSTGLLSPLADGEAVITVTSGSGVDSTAVTVRYREPLPVTLDPVDWSGTYPELSWSPAADDAFCSYAVRRSGNWGGPERVIATLDQRAQTAYVDQDMVKLLGVSVEYTVEVVNGPFAVASDASPAALGSFISESVQQQPLVSSAYDQLYAATGLLGETLTVLSSVTHFAVHARPISHGQRVFAESGDGTALYALRHFFPFQTDSLYTIDTQTFVTTDVVGLPPGRRLMGPLAYGRSGRAYTSVESFPSRTTSVVVIDSDTGADLGSVLAFPDASQSTAPVFLLMSPDQDRLHAVKGTEVVLLDVSTDAPAVVDRRTMPYSVGVARASPDGAYLHLAELFKDPGAVAVLDTQTLQTITLIATGPVFDLFAAPGGLYVSESFERPGDLYFLSGRVRRYAPLASQPSATWDVLRVPSWIAVSRDEATLYAQGTDDRTLFVPIGP
jgi:hypothetical protein